MNNYEYNICCTINGECFNCGFLCDTAPIIPKLIDSKAKQFIASQIEDIKEIEIVLVVYKFKTSKNIDLYNFYRERHFKNREEKKRNELLLEYKLGDLEVKKIILDDYYSISKKRFDNFLKECKFEL